MAEFSFQCPACNCILAVDSTVAGAEVCCPECGTTQIVPVPELASADDQSVVNETTSPVPGQIPIEQEENADYRYDAFISYRHVEPDRKWAKWLHTALETYRVPRKLMREKGLSRRLRKVFRDEEELPASADLSDEIERALQQSRFLIVVCSPRTPESQWVSQEIIRFRQMGRDNKVLALLVDGEPGEAFPLALRHVWRSDFNSAGKDQRRVEEIEPLAADVRPIRREGRYHIRRMAKLRMLACVLGVSFDDLRQRERARRLRQWLGFGGAAVCLGLGLLFLAGASYVSHRRAELAQVRAELEHSRAETEKERAARAETESARQKKRLLQTTINDRVGKAWQLYDQGDRNGALLFAVEALRLTHENIAPGSNRNLAEINHRIRIGQFLSEIPSPRAVLVHKAAVAQEVVFSADGSRVATRENKGVRVWDKSTGVPVTGLLPHPEGVWGVQFYAEGERIVTWGQDATVRLWNLKNGKVLATLGKASTGVWQGIKCVVSPDNQRVVTGDDGGLQLWDANNGAKIGSRLEQSDEINRIEYISSGRLLAHRHGNIRLYATMDGRPVTAWTPCNKMVVDKTHGRLVITSGKTVQVIVAESGQMLLPAFKYESVVASIFLSDDGNLLLVVCEVPRIYNLTTGLAVKIPVEIDQAQFSPDGKRLVVSRNTTARIYNVDTGEPMSGVMTHSSLVRQATFSRDGKLLVTVDDTARIWDAQSGSPMTLAFRGSSDVREARFSSDARMIATLGNNEAQVWDTATGKSLSLPLKHEGIGRVDFTPDCRLVITDDLFQGRVEDERYWDARTGESLLLPAWLNNLTHVRISGNRVIVPDTYTGGAFQLWSLPRGLRPVPEQCFGTSVVRCDLSPDGSRAVTGGADGIVQIWNAETGQPIASPIQHKGAIKYLAYSKDGSRIVSFDNKSALWDAHTAEKLGDDKKEALRSMFPVFYSADGKRVVASVTWTDRTAIDISTGRTSPREVATGKVVVKEVATGKELTPALPPKSDIRAKALSPDGRLLVTSSTDGSVNIWDVATAKSVYQLLQNGGASWVVFSSDGKKIATTTHKTVQVWSAVTGEAFTPALPFDATFSEQPPVTFSSDSQRLIASGPDETARVWDAESGLLVLPPLAHEGSVDDIACSDDDRKILTAGGNRNGTTTRGISAGCAMVWDVPVESRPVQELMLLAQVLSQRTIDSMGDIVQLRKEKVIKLWQEYVQQHQLASTGVRP